MSLVITDVTAGAVVLTIDNNGNMAFANGTPINALTVGPNAIIDSDGYILFGLSACAISGTAGSVNCGIHQMVNITTSAGRTPTVQLDSQYPANNYFIDFRDPSDPTQGGTESVTPQYGIPVHIAEPLVGAFSIVNQNSGDGNVDNPSSEYYDSSLATAECGYRWI